MLLSSHEILRFSIDQATMRFRHLGLYSDRASIALRDHAPERNLWELMKTGAEVRLTRFPKLRPVSFDGPTANRFTATITSSLFERVVETHRAAIIQMIRKQVERLAEERARASSLSDAGSQHDANMAGARLEEVRAAAARLLPRDFAG